MKRIRRTKPHNKKKKIDRAARRSRTLARMILEGPTENERMRTKQRHLHNDALPFQEDILPIGKSKEVTDLFFFDKIFPKRAYKREEKAQDFRILTANLYDKSDRKPLRISMNKNFYNKHPRLSGFMPNLIRILEKEGYLIRHPGFQNDKRKRQTRIYPTDKFQVAVLEHPELSNGFHLGDGGDLILLGKKLTERELTLPKKEQKKRKKKKIKFRESKYTRDLRNKLQYINESNRKFAVVHHYGKDRFRRLNTDIHAVFHNGTFDHGGRFYTRKNGHLGLYREERPDILIDWKKTIELDYGGLHPCLLYASQGIQFEGDPYAMAYPLAKKDKKFRDNILKPVLLTLLNAESEKEMVSSGNLDLHLRPRNYRYMKMLGLKITDILARFKLVHPDIAKYFCSGKGVELMNLDSKIAIKVLLHFADKGKGCLCVHDSFIVQRRDGALLRRRMEEAYREITEVISPDHRPYTCCIK